MEALAVLLIITLLLIEGRSKVMSAEKVVRSGRTNADNAVGDTLSATSGWPGRTERLRAILYG